MYRLWYFVTLFAGVIVQQLFFVPLADYIQSTPLLPIVLLTIFSVAAGSYTAEGLGFFCGFAWSFAQIDNGTPQGAMPLLLSIIAFMLGRFFHDRFKAPSAIWVLIWLAAASLFFGIGMIALKLIFIENYRPHLVDFASLFLSMIYTCLLGLAIYPPMREILKRREWNGSI